MKVENGKKIKIEYTGKLEDGSVFDSSEKQGSPLEFEAGSGKIIKGLDSEIIGMALNEEKEIIVEPAMAYGDRKPELEQVVAREKFPEMPLEAGQTLMLGDQQGNKFPVVIAEVTQETVKLDLNHPLAGKKLFFNIKVVGID